MAMRDRPIYRVLFFVVLAPVGAAVVITLLLLAGVEPRVVFFFGHAVRAGLGRLGIDAPNQVGVVSTVFFWWAPIALLGAIWERRRRRAS